MKDKKDSSASEPTLGDILAVMNERFTLVEATINHGFAKVDASLKIMNDRMDNIDARLGDVQRRVTKIDMRVEDIQDDLTSALDAVDKDAVTILDHGRRIAHLEKSFS